MSIKNEKDRINVVYEHYLKNKSFKRKWSADNYGNKVINIELRRSIIQNFIKNRIITKNKNILDIGCASGNKINFLIQLGFNKNLIFGIDIRDQSINEAKKNFSSSHFFNMDARQLLFEDNKFDFVNIFTLLSSIKSKKNRQKVCNEIFRVLKPNGNIIYYDLRYRNPFNKNVYPIYKKDIKSLFYDRKISMKTITLLPPLARSLGRATNYIYPLLSKIKFLKTHYFCMITNSIN